MADPDADRQLAAVRARGDLTALILEDRPERQAVEKIIRQVHADGDAALQTLTAKLDRAEISPTRLRVDPDQLSAAWDAIDAPLKDAIDTAIRQVRAFQQHILIPPAGPLTTERGTLEARYRPVHRAGVCVPGAAAPLPSSMIHSAVPAQVAGVKQLAVVAPPCHHGDVHPVILGVAHALGINEVYRVGGAQAVAALALGTETIRRVDKIVGPGSLYVQLAKRALYGVVDIDMFAGPSEVVVIADESADPRFIAADLLAQAEHDPGSAILLTPSETLIAAVIEQLEIQLADLSRAEGARRSLRELSALILVRDMDEAVMMAERMAPEHLQIETDNAAELADRIDSAGAIFLGHHTPEAAGDYVSGPSHVLPTGGSARYFSGLSCNDFLRRSSVLHYDADGLAAEAPAIDALAMAEGLDAHANSVRVRIEKRGDA
jgi:histidinol dehydrogenase